MAIDKRLQVFDEEGNPVDYDILASDVKFNNGEDLPTKLAEMEDEIGEGGYTPPAGGIPKTDLTPSVQQTLDDVANKVDKVPGKGLSTNDYTTEDKSKLDNLPTNPVQSISVNGGTAQTPTNGNVNIEVEGGGETVVINSDGADIVDSHSNPSILVAPSARQMYMAAQNIDTLFRKVNDLYDKLAGIAFTDGKPANWKEYVDWSSVAIPTHTITLGTMTNVSASIGGTAISGSTSVNEGEVTIKLTPAQGAMIIAENISIKSGTDDVPFTTAADNGSTLVTFVLAGDVTVAASASSGRNIIFTGSTGCSIGAAGVAIGQDLDTTITANEHYTLPQSITVKIGNSNVTHTYTRAQDNKTATLHIDAVNITGDLTITCTADEDAHVTIVISGSNFVVKQGNTQLSNSSKVYNGSAAQTITIEPASGYKFSTLPSADKGTMTNNGPYEASSLEIGTSVSGTLTITAAGSALQTFSIDLSGLVGVASSNAATSIQEGAPYSTTLSKTDASAAGSVIVGSCTMGSENIAPSSGLTISVAHVTGDIVLAATVGVAQMKVHSWDLTNVQGSADNKPRYLEDDVAGSFRLYSVGDVGELSPSWSPSGGTYAGGVYANGQNDGYTAGYGLRTLNVGNGDFTIAMKGVKIAYRSGQTVAYGTKQFALRFFDSAAVNTVHGGQSQYTSRQFQVQMYPNGDNANISSGYMFPYVIYNNNGAQRGCIGTSAGVPVTAPSGHTYHVFITFAKATGLFTAYIVDVYNGTATVSLCGTLSSEQTGIEVSCLCVSPVDEGTWITKDYLTGIDLYNYAMSQSDIENEFSD